MISVVIPLYNKAHTIERTLGSVLNQTFTNFEVVIVNDGSTDNGVEVIKNFTSDPRIRIINQENQGVSVARNRGVAESKYEYIAFLDGDDEWLPAYLFKMVEAIKMYPDAGMFCCAGYVRDNNGIHYRLAKKYKGKTLIVNYFENPQVFTHTSAVIVRKTEFNKSEGFPLKMRCNEDFALTYKVALITQVVYVGELLSVYVGGVEGQITSISNEERFRLLSDVVKRFNISYSLWLKTEKQNKLYLVFDKYEIRSRIYGFLQRNDYKSIHFFINNLSDDIKLNFFRIEFKLYRVKKLNLICQLYILLTKLIWRIHRFPIVGEIPSKKISNYE